MTRPAHVDRRKSLRWRLLAAVCAAVLLIWLLTGWLSYIMARHEAEELMDGSLAQTGHLLLAIIEDDQGELAGLASRLARVRRDDNDVYEPPLEFQVGRGDGTILARSLDAPDLPILGVAGYSDIIRREESWRVLNLTSADGRHRVQVSQPISLRDRAALEVASQTVLPLLVIVPLLVLLIYFSIRRGLLPLDRLASEVAARTPDNLAPLSGGEVPTEARPLVNSINRLFARVSRTLENERRFTADAAHELRTPLAALKVQTQVALLSTDAPMRKKALHQIESGVDRAGHLLEQLLRLARLDPVQRLEQPVPVALAALVREAIGVVRGAHPEADRRLVAALPAAEVHVPGDPELLRVALRNLLDNAVRYSRPGDSVRVALEATGREVALSVHDSGPGVPEEAVGKLAERFYRGRDHSTQGTGLGLAIVTRIVELHGARLSLGNHPDGGFVARIEGLRALPPGDIKRGLSGGA
ncbi:MAG: ATP-binding protein [Gammaproteobacteria bacterium]